MTKYQSAKGDNRARETSGDLSDSRPWKGLGISNPLVSFLARLHVLPDTVRSQGLTVLMDLILGSNRKKD